MTNVYQLDEKYTQQTRWAPLRLRGFPEPQLSHRFADTDDLQGLILSVSIEKRDWTLQYGMSRQDLGSAWGDDRKARQRLKALAKAELRKDLFLLVGKKMVPDAALRIKWIDSRGRVISSEDRNAG